MEKSYGNYRKETMTRIKKNLQFKIKLSFVCSSVLLKNAIVFLNKMYRTLYIMASRNNFKETGKIHSINNLLH